MIASIAHPTDFSERSAVAFAHALRLALAAKCRLLLLHVTRGEIGHQWTSFPHVRALLTSWGMLNADAAPRDIASRLGIDVRKIEIRHEDPAAGLCEFFLSQRPDFIVLSTQGRDGFAHWLNGPVSEELASRSHVPTLFFGPHAEGFVDTITGRPNLERVLVPVAHAPSPALALSTLKTMVSPLEVVPPSVRFLHVGEKAPALPEDEWVELKRGPVLDTILSTVVEDRIQLIVMPTAGRHGFLDVLRGSTTERVLREACCPVLAVKGFANM